MGYVTNGEIAQRLGSAAYVQLTDDAGAGAANEGIVSDARLAAEAEANSYLGRRMTVPVDLAQVPAVAAAIRGAVLDLAAYRLHLRRPPVPADVAKRRQEAIGWLERVARGEVALATTVAGLAEGPARVLSRETLERL